MAKKKSTNTDDQNLTDEPDSTQSTQLDRLIAACEAMKAKFEKGHTIVDVSSYDRYPGLADVVRALQEQ